MRMLQTLFALILVTALCGCGAAGGQDTTQPSGEAQEGEAMEITSFSFTHTGMSTDECFRYSAEQTEEGVRLYTEELFVNGLIVDTLIDEPILEQLGEIAGKYHLDQWDGFDKSNKRVTDGSRFSLSVELADGSTISARGNNKFPDGYADAKGEICALFEDLIDRYKNQH